MEKSLEIIKATRTNFNKLIDGLSIDALNEIPEKLNNNIIWNYGHIIAAQQVLCYKLSGLENKIDPQYIDKYRKGTKPELPIDQHEVDILKNYSTSNIDELIVDLKNELFTGFKPYMSGFGIELRNIDDAIKFISIHESLHLGYAMVIKRLLKK